MKGIQFSASGFALITKEYQVLNEGVDANYRDKQGLPLLHLAAVFNQTDIVFILMDSGASLEYKNAQDNTSQPVRMHRYITSSRNGSCGNGAPSRMAYSSTGGGTCQGTCRGSVYY